MKIYERYLRTQVKISELKGRFVHSKTHKILPVLVYLKSLSRMIAPSWWFVERTNSCTQSLSSRRLSPLEKPNLHLGFIKL